MINRIVSIFKKNGMISLIPNNLNKIEIINVQRIEEDDDENSYGVIPHIWCSAKFSAIDK